MLLWALCSFLFCHWLYQLHCQSLWLATQMHSLLNIFITLTYTHGWCATTAFSFFLNPRLSDKGVWSRRIWSRDRYGDIGYNCVIGHMSKFVCKNWPAPQHIPQETKIQKADRQWARYQWPLHKRPSEALTPRAYSHWTVRVLIKYLETHRC